MDVGWLSSQLVVGVVVVVLVVGGLAFFAVVEPRRGAPAEGAGAAPGGAGAHEHGQGAGEVDPPGGAAVGAAGGAGSGVPGEAGSGHPGGAATASVFETEPCWQSLMRGRQAPAEAPVADAAATREDPALIEPGRAGEGAVPPTSAGEDAAAPG
jgi:class 4 POU domain transcription factor